MNNSLPNNSGVLNNMKEMGKSINSEDLKTYLLTSVITIILFVLICVMLGQKTLNETTIVTGTIIFVVILIIYKLFFSITK